MNNVRTTQEYRIAVNVLGYREEKDYVALALEMDLRGYGSSFEEALRDLDEQVVMQLSFALYKYGAVDMAMWPAEAVYFERFAEAKREAIMARGHEVGREFAAASIPYPSPDDLENMKRGFERQHV